MYMVVEWTSGGLPWRKYKVGISKVFLTDIFFKCSFQADNREEVLRMKEEVRDKEEAMNNTNV
ncbi:unnamed protein product [Cylicostephanus goldi]|uniref:Uncharacterized protein n=1 Tax=Cylicostephanus goldi TaxID=71465 RepID=A0A3P7Q2P1_CYLGO|nr:unnamed protein product [Cylicostephanus goldi]